MSVPLLTVENLTIALPAGADRPNAVENVSFTLAAGEILCIVGESGSGKSISASAIMGLLPKRLPATGGRIVFDGQNLLTLSKDEMRAIRAKRIAMIFQEPMTALNPIMPVGEQIAEVLEAHGVGDTSSRRARAIELLGEVGIPSPEQTVDAYPFRLSGGQRQRVMIAMALALKPSILICDEPTTALDVTTQAQILVLIRDLQKNRGTGILFVTHDFGVVAEIADRIAVMQHGCIVELGTRDAVLDRPQHAYTRKLIAAVPRLVMRKGDEGDAAPLLTISNVSKTYWRGGLFSKKTAVHAVKNVSLSLQRGETVALVGESGSGKSTLARCVVRLIEPTSGEIHVNGREITSLSQADMKPLRRQIQMVFQDPFASLNPRKRVGEIIAEGPITHGTPRDEAMKLAKEWLGLVGLDPLAIDRFPHEFSGGQRQRIGLARALALEPELLIADEPVSALDVSVQAQVLKLIADMKKRMNLTMLFITHDLRVASEIADRIAVMRYGEIVELGTPAHIFGSPQHAYTRALIDAIPGVAWEATRPKMTLSANAVQA
jgi:peptide/nickel transport system ATP-binding protein